MNTPRPPAMTPPGESYGFYCTLSDMRFTEAIAREEAHGGQAVGFMDPVAVMQMTDDPEVARVAAEVRARLERVRAALAAPAPT